MNIEIKLLDKQTAQDNKPIICLLMKELEHGLTSYELEEYCTRKYENMLRFIEDGTAIVFGGFSENVLIAYAWGYLRKSEEDRKRMHITQIVVSEQYRDQGIGRRLLANMQEYAKEKNWYGMELNVHRQNYNARKFYERNGFICEKLFLIKNHIKP